MKFIDLAAQQQRIRSRIEARFKQVLDHGAYVMGPEITELENKLAEFSGAKYALSCASGTDALLIPLMALGIGKGDLIYTTPFTFMATAEVISLLGATPVFVDVEEDTFNIDVIKLAEAISESKKLGTPRGIIAVDLFGAPADYEEINAIAKQYGLFVIEDAAQSFGASYKGHGTGSLAPIAATSFFPAKPLGCYGDGGAIFCEDQTLLQDMSSIRIHGQGEDKYQNVRIGINGRMDTLQAAVVLEKLEIFPEEIELRNSVAKRYSDGFSDVVKTPVVKKDRTSVWAQYSILTNERDALVSHLKSAGVPTAIYYTCPLHLQPAFSYLQYQEGDCPVSESLAGRILSLPMHPYLSEEDQEQVVNAVRAFFN